MQREHFQPFQKERVDIRSVNVGKLGFSSFGGKMFLFLVKLQREAFAPPYLGLWALCTQYFRLILPK